MESSLVERHHLTFLTLYSRHHLTRFPPPVVKAHSHVQGFCHISIQLALFLTQKTLSESCVQRPPAPASWEKVIDHFDSGWVMMDHTRWIQFNSLRIQLAEAPGEHGIVDKLRLWSRAHFDLLPRANFASLGTSTEDFCSGKVIPVSSKEMWFKQEQSRDWRECFW